MTTVTLSRYQNYRFILGNRGTKRTYVNKLRRQLEHNNGEVPDTVEWIITVNGRGEIVDGQCHWQAIMDYNTRHPKNQIQSIFVIVETNAGLARAKEINNTSTKWKEVDYFDSWIALGHSDYAVLRRIRQTEAGKACGLAIVLRVCGYLEDKDADRKFKNGEFEMIREEDNAIEMLGYIARCHRMLGDAFGTKQLALITFAKCLLIPGIDKEHLVRRVSRPAIEARGFHYSISADGIVSNINIVYNRELSNTRVSRLDIVNLYRDVQEYNWHNMRSATRQPNLRTNRPRPVSNPDPDPNPPAGAGALRPPHVNTPLPRRRTLRDDGVVPV